MTSTTFAATAGKTLAALDLAEQDLKDLVTLGYPPTTVVNAAFLEDLGEYLDLLSDDGAVKLQAEGLGLPLVHQPHPTASGPKRHARQPAPAMA